MRTSKDSPGRVWSIHNSDDIGRAIAGVRAQRRLTQEQLAREVGVDRSYLAKLEAGPSQLVLERSLRALRRMGATITVSIPRDDEPR
jgi:transcriptional regulator with XRE-family HTH domain